MMQIRVAASDIVFPCTPGETVLDAAERAGYVIPYSCRKGVCSSCEGRLVSGEAQVRGRGTARGPEERVMMCQARPMSDVEIEPKRIGRREPPVRKTLSARVFRIVEAAPDVTVLQLRFPNGVRGKFAAGQYLRILLPDGDSRNYSIANPPRDNDGVQLHIRRIQGGRFSERILPKLARGDKLTIELPYGQFVVDESSRKPIILLATGTGFAPFRSIIEDRIRRGSSDSVHLYWGGRRREDLYLSRLAERWAASLPWFSYTPVLSMPGADWRGHSGYVQHATISDHPDLSGHQVYACGSPEMIDGARTMMQTEAGLHPDDFFSDAFVPSGNDEAGNDAV